MTAVDPTNPGVKITAPTQLTKADAGALCVTISCARKLCCDLQCLRALDRQRLFQGDDIIGNRVAINTQADPFKDRRVRQALNYAVDREALVKNAYSGLAAPLGGPVAPAIRGAAPLAAYPFDPARARKLLAEAGYPNGLEAPLLGGKGRFPGDVALASGGRSLIVWNAGGALRATVGRHAKPTVLADGKPFEGVSATFLGNGRAEVGWDAPGGHVVVTRR